MSSDRVSTTHHPGCRGRAEHRCTEAEDASRPVDPSCTCAVCVDGITLQRPVPPASGPIDLEIRAEHIAAGVQHDLERNPAALALRALYPDAEQILVDEADIDVLGPGTRSLHGSCGGELSDWILDFHEGAPAVKPGRCQIWLKQHGP